MNARLLAWVYGPWVRHVNPTERPEPTRGVRAGSAQQNVKLIVFKTSDGVNKGNINFLLQADPCHKEWILSVFSEQRPPLEISIF